MEQAVSSYPAATLPPPQRAVDAAPLTPDADSDGTIVHVAGLCKKFRIYPRPWGRITEWLTLGRAVRHQDFWALRDVSFDVRRGESLGIIGVNGSGKSTLLKILSRAMYPTGGDVAIRGRVLSLLELGTGLNLELTGRQNVINSARLLGFPPEFAGGRMAQIESFAELGDFFDRPVRLYSSGMLVRLSFSMFACFDPEIFIVDEALSVGDVFFQQKCARRIQQMRAAGTTMLFVSHDLAAVEALCDRVIVLHGGRVRHDGDKKLAIARYYALGGAGLASTNAEAGIGADPPSTIRELEFARSEVAEVAAAVESFDPLALTWHAPSRADAFGDGAVTIEGICFKRRGGADEPVVARGQWLDVFARLRAVRDVEACNAGLAIHDRTNRLVFARGWLNADLPPLKMRVGDVAVARFALKLDLEPDEYIVGLAVTQALPDPRSPTGWNQDVGGTRFIELPRAAVIAVVPAADGRRESFGPANLRTQLDRVVIRDATPDREAT